MENRTDSEANCIFCKVIVGEAPSTKVYEDEHVFVILDIHPINEGHTLVIPKKHVSSFHDMEDDLYHKVFTAVKKVANTLKKTVQNEHVGLAISGFDVNHTHVHVVPLMDKHDLTSQKALNDTKPQFTVQERQATAEKIKSALNL